MAGGKDGESSKKSKGKGKAPMVIDYSDQEMEEAEAHDLSATQEPVFSQPRDQTQRHSELPVLDPTTLWFDDNKVRSAVSGTLTRYYRDPWRNYGEVDEGTKQHWWNLFSKQFTWAPQLHEHVKQTFERKFATRLRDMFYTVTHKMNGAKPVWLNEEVHKKMMDIVATDPTYKKRSAQNRKNRRGGSMENVVEPTHYQGSMSAIQHAKRMAAKNQGQLPTAPELFLKTHFKDVPGKGTVPTNTKAKQIAEAYQKKVEEASTQGIRKSPNELYWETVGGRNKKGRVKGLGQSAELYYGNRMGRVSTSSQQYTPSIVSQMQDQVEQKVQALRSEMEVEMEARLAAIERRNQERWDEMMRRFPGNDTCSTIQPQSRDPRDDPGSGSARQGTPAVA